MFDFIIVPFGYVIRWFDSLTGNYLLTLFLFAIIMKLVLLPLGIKQQKNQIKQASLRPKETAIRRKYAGRTDKATQQKVQQEVMDLYQRENFNPMGGCLPMILQLVIVVILYSIIRNPLTYICGLGKDAVETIVTAIKEIEPAYKGVDELSHIGAITQYGLQDLDVLKGVNLPNFNFFGIDFSATPQIAFNWLLLVPVLVFVSQFGTMKLSRKFTYQSEQQGDAAKSMAIMDITMPLMSVWFAFNMPAVIGIYWVMQSVLSLIQTILLAKFMPLPRFTEEDYKNAERELKGKSPKHAMPDSTAGTKGKVRSLHHIDDDDEDEVAVAPKTQAPKESVIEQAPLKEDDKDSK
jgi:YidC/Oxa1 family membrane protein insertase